MNPYRVVADPETCASCGAPIVQRGKGRPRRFCDEDQCRRAGSQQAALVSAWDEGWDAAARAKNPTGNDVEDARADAFAAGYRQGRETDRRYVAALTAAVWRHLRKCMDLRGHETIRLAILRVKDRHGIEDEREHQERGA